MFSGTGASATDWWRRAAQARRVAAMLSPQDARTAEAYAVECEARARDTGRSHSAGTEHGLTLSQGLKSTGKLPAKRAA
jgi:hypothetical protein